MKHLQEHKLLIDKAKARNLTEEQIFLLLAIREVEDGEKGNEFNLKVVKNTNLSTQADWVIDFIICDSKFYLDYIMALGISEPMGFISFFASQNLMIKEGMFQSPFWVADVSAISEKISKEYYGFTNAD